MIKFDRLKAVVLTFFETNQAGDWQFKIASSKCGFCAESS